MPQSLAQWRVFLFVVGVGVLVSRFPQWVFMGKVLNDQELAEKVLTRLGKSEDERKDWKTRQLGVGLQQWVGGIEIILYASCVVLQHVEFIAVWFATKYIAVWRSWGEEPAGRTFYNCSLFGSGLNILLGFATGEVARWAISHVG